MKYIKFIYNSFLWALTIATLCFKNEWLQMRVNTGLIFFGLMILITLILCLVARKRELNFNWIFTLGSLAVCTLIGIVVYGFKRMQVVPAALIREGINQTSIPFGTINKVLFVVTLSGFVVILLSDLLKKKNK